MLRNEIYAIVILGLLVTPVAACNITNDASRSCLETHHWLTHTYGDSDTEYMMVMAVENLNRSEDRFFPTPEPGDVPIVNATITLRPNHVDSEEWTILNTCYTDDRGMCMMRIPDEYKGKDVAIVIDYYDASMAPYCDSGSWPSDWPCGITRYTDTYFPEPGLPWYVWLIYLTPVVAVIAAYVVYRKWKKEDERRRIPLKEG